MRENQRQIAYLILNAASSESYNADNIRKVINEFSKLSTDADSFTEKDAKTIRDLLNQLPDKTTAIPAPASEGSSLPRQFTPPSPSPSPASVAAPTPTATPTIAQPKPIDNKTQPVVKTAVSVRASVVRKAPENGTLGGLNFLNHTGKSTARKLAVSGKLLVVGADLGAR